MYRNSGFGYFSCTGKRLVDWNFYMLNKLSTGRGICNRPHDPVLWTWDQEGFGCRGKIHSETKWDLFAYPSLGQWGGWCKRSKMIKKNNRKKLRCYTRGWLWKGALCYLALLHDCALNKCWIEHKFKKSWAQLQWYVDKCEKTGSLNLSFLLN